MTNYCKTNEPTIANLYISLKCLQSYTIISMAKRIKQVAKLILKFSTSPFDSSQIKKKKKKKSEYAYIP
jgi:hypothetical protein